MSLLVNRARMTTSTVGTGALTLGLALAGYLSLNEAGVPNGATVTYTIEDGSNIEIGRGVYNNSALTLTRGAIIVSKINGQAADTSPISLSGSAIVYLTAAAEDLLSRNAAIADNAVLRGDGGAGGTQSSSVTIDDNGNLAQPGYHDQTEIVAPANPDSNIARVYAADDGSGVTTLTMRDSAGNVNPLSHFLQAGTGAVTRTQHDKLREVVSVKDFGAVGDSNGTAGNGTDDRAAFNAALAYASTIGAVVFIPPGKYRISNGLVLDESGRTDFLEPRASIVGAGARASYLIYDNGTYDGLTVVGPGANNLNAESKQAIGGFTLYKTDGQGTGLVYTDIARARTFDLVSIAWDLGGWCIDVQESLWENCLFVFNLHGFKAQTDNFTKPNALTFIGCTMGNNQNWGMDIVDPAVVNYYGGSIESNGGVGSDPVRWGARIIWSDGANPEGNQACTFNGVYFERNDDLGDLYFTNSALPMTWSVTACNFNRGSTQGSGSGVFGTNCIRLETSGGFHNVLNIQGNGFGGLPRSGPDAYSASASRPYIGIVNPTEPLTVVDAGNGYRDAVERPVWYAEGGVAIYRTDSLAVSAHHVSNNADANPGPYSVLFRDSASPAATDFGGVIAFDFRNSAAAKIRGAQIAARIIDPTSTSEDIETVFFNYVAGTPTQSMGVANGLVVGSATYDGTGTIKAEGSIKSAGATAGVGYATGAGGTVVQATNKTTGVTLNKVCGQITLAAGTINAGAEATFAVTNSAVGTTDCVVVNHDSVGTSGAYGVFAHNIGVGSFSITVTNLSAGNLDEQIVLNFVVIKAVAA